MTVDISGAQVQDGTAGSLFDNNGGSLRITNLQASGLTSPALVATSNGGNSFLQDSTVFRSSLDAVTATSGVGAQSILNLEVREMLAMVNTFRVQDAGTQLKITSARVTNNKLTTRWSAVQVQTGATAKISELNMNNNRGVAFGVSAVGAKTNVQIADSFIKLNTGTVRYCVLGRLQATSSEKIRLT
jgi:hypothetical protein